MSESTDNSSSDGKVDALVAILVLTVVVTTAVFWLLGR